MFAVIYVPDFAVEALVRAAPELREQALAVVEGAPPLLTVVGTNERARQCGVEAGMTALQAEERLFQPRATPPQNAQNRGVLGAPAAGPHRACIRRRSAAQEQAAHAALLDCACAFSPRVEDTAADTILLDLAGLDRLFGPPATMACELARRAAQGGMQASLAVAGNPDAAMHAARGFPGVTVIPLGKEAERLGELPVDVLCRTAEGGCATSPEMIETLDRWGVRNLRALAALPEVAVAQRLGQEGVHWQRLARGEGSRPLRVTEPPLRFEEAVELEYPVALLEPLAFLLNRMLEQLCFRLGARALAAQELRLRLQLDIASDPDNPPQRRTDAENGVSSFAFHVSRESDRRETRTPKRETFFERAIKLPVPMLDPKVFLKLLQLDLQAHPPGAPVTKVWLEAEPAEPRRAQSGLFVPLTPEAEKLELTLARISSVVSRQSSVASEARVGTPEVLDTHRPDAFRMKKFNPFASPVASRQSPVASKTQGPSTRAPTPGALAQDDNHLWQLPIANGQSPTATLAMRMVRPPLAITVELRDGIPQRIRETGNAKRETREVVWAAGPWRGSGDWWTEQPWGREEWDVAMKHADGVALYRIYRDGGGGWFVEAEYD